MLIESVPIADLHADPANARKHSQRNLDAIAASLARFGQQKPIVVNPANVVLAGNGTLAAAKSLGWTHIRAIRTALAGADATAFAIADNRTAELAEWDDDVLKQLLESPDLGDVGFTDDEIARISSTADESPLAINASYQVVIECKDEADQKTVYERMTGDGYECRLLML